MCVVTDKGVMHKIHSLQVKWNPGRWHRVDLEALGNLESHYIIGVAAPNDFSLEQFLGNPDDAEFLFSDFERMPSRQHQTFGESRHCATTCKLLMPFVNLEHSPNTVCKGSYLVLGQGWIARLFCIKELRSISR